MFTWKTLTIVHIYYNIILGNIFGEISIILYKDKVTSGLTLLTCQAVSL
jgi:hypothetical protein